MNISLEKMEVDSSAVTKNVKRMSVALALVIITTSLVACSDGTDSSGRTDTQNDNGNDNGNGGEGTEGDDAGVVVLTGHFIDSRVEGLAYATDTRNGYTDAEGSFLYLEGENIQFYIGDPFLTAQAWHLGSAQAHQIMSPLDLAGEEFIEPSVVNMLRFLQTLDLDGNADDGITLPSVVDVLPDGSASVDFNSSLSAFEQNPFVLDFIARARSVDSLVNDRQAVEHFQKTLNRHMPKPAGRWALHGAGAANGNSPEGLQATIEFVDGASYTATVSGAGIAVRVEARYKHVELDIITELQEISLSTEQQQLFADVSDDSWDEVIGMAGDLLSSSMKLALGIDARLILLPDHLLLESADGAVQLAYARDEEPSDEVDTSGEVDATPVAGYVQLEPLIEELNEVGQQLQLTATVHAEDGAMLDDVALIWRSSDESVVMVDSQGVITVIGNGTATVSVSGAGISTSIVVTVQIHSEPEQILCPDAQMVPTMPEASNDVSVEQVNITDNEDSVVQENTYTINQQGDSGTRCDSD